MVMTHVMTDSHEMRHGRHETCHDHDSFHDMHHGRHETCHDHNSFHEKNSKLTIDVNAF